MTTTCAMCGHEDGGARHDVGAGGHRAQLTRSGYGSAEDRDYDQRAREFAERHPVELLPKRNARPGAGTSRRPVFGALPADEQRWIELSLGRYWKRKGIIE